MFIIYPIKISKFIQDTIHPSYYVTECIDVRHYIKLKYNIIT